METLDDTESRHHFPLQKGLCGTKGIGVTQCHTACTAPLPLYSRDFFAATGELQLHEFHAHCNSGFDSKEWIYVFTVWNTLARDKNGLEFQRLLAINVEAIETIPVIPQIIVLQCTSDSSKFKTRIQS
jgi:hypothetical protein